MRLIMQRSRSPHSRSRGPVLVVGGGIGGVETALALRDALPGERVVLVCERPHLLLVPNLVYVPFGQEPHVLRIPLRERLEGRGIEVLHGRACSVGHACELDLVDGRTVRGRAVVAACGTQTMPTEGFPLRTAEHASALHKALTTVVASPRQTREIHVRILDRSSWTPPAFELAMLLDAWLLSRALRDRIDLRVSSAGDDPLAPFGGRMAAAVFEQVTERQIGLELGAPLAPPSGHVLAIDFGALRARVLDGIGPTGTSGFYEVPESGELRPGVYVAGDAAHHPFKAAFATTAQARSIAIALGADPERLARDIDGVPHGRCEYQMDLGLSTLLARMPASANGAVPRDDDVELKIVRPAPEKLRGTLIREQLLTPGERAALGRAVLRRPATTPPPA